ncbi:MULTISPECIES: phosphotransferase family protein [Halolamina]|uniref:Phosphotransferase enzyme family protein n=1 Tax=Halolamina pelagica TaxID=699431 RepID=A0A1I5S900_9EURY|nr:MULTISPECIES: aminoglycoside phosphotransferase family protein [Halolamina]NHX37168.1 aminoglycoside phosphotransferase family protein [Halolamina sp. R1-12]SFP67278.1 Phosphotransferase enzyme family protein [Halolamina pelagica]
MHDEIHDALSTHTDEYEIVRERHRVRPHATYEVRFRGERAVCKLEIHPEAELGREAAAMRYVDAATSIPVPELLAVGDDHFVARWDDSVPRATPTRDEARIRALGRGLATLHADTAEIGWTGRLEPASVVDDPTEPPVETEPRWSDTLIALLERRARFLDGVGYGDLAREVLGWVREDRALFDAAGDAVLCHGNYFGEHVGLDTDGEVAAVIDFEHALAAPAEWDYLRTVLPVFGPGADHDVPEAVFREAYESVRPLPTGFDRCREALTLCNGLSYLRSLHLQRGDRDAPHAVARRARRLAASIRDRLAAVRDENRGLTDA